MKEGVAVGGGGTHQIGYVNTCVLHGFTVPVDEEMVFGLDALRTIRLALSGFQQLSFLFQFGGVLDVTLVTVEIVILFARGTLGGAAHVTHFHLAMSE